MKFVKYNKVSEYCRSEIISPDLITPLVMLIRTAYPVGLTCKYHQIDCFYTALIIEGEMTYQERGKSALTGRRGDLFILSASNDYCWEVTAPTVSLQCQHNGFPVRQYGMTGSVFGNQNYPVTMVNLGEATTSAFEWEIERNSKDKFNNLYYSSAILRLLADTAGRISGLSSGNDTQSANALLASQCAAYIEKRLSKPIDIGQMAHVFRISKRKLFLLFHAHFGMPPLRYIAIRKIERARKLILSTSMSNDEIATILGFTDTNYFIRFFKKHTGLSPMQTRKNADNGKHYS